MNTKIRSNAQIYLLTCPPIFLTAKVNFENLRGWVKNVYLSCCACLNWILFTHAGTHGSKRTVWTGDSLMGGHRELHTQPLPQDQLALPEQGSEGREDKEQFQVASHVGHLLLLPLSTWEWIPLIPPLLFPGWASGFWGRTLLCLPHCPQEMGGILPCNCCYFVNSCTQLH